MKPVIWAGVGEKEEGLGLYGDCSGREGEGGREGGILGISHKKMLRRMRVFRQVASFSTPSSLLYTSQRLPIFQVP